MTEQDVLKYLLTAGGGSGSVILIGYFFIRKLMSDFEKKMTEHDKAICETKKMQAECRSRCDNKIYTQHDETITLRIDFMNALQKIEVSLARIEAKEDVVGKLKILLEEKRNA